MATRVETNGSSKLRGGYYTPSRLANSLVDWAIREKFDRVLEPSCGDGAFVEQAAIRLLRLGATETEAANQITGIELAENEAGKAATRLKSRLKGVSADIVAGDYFEWFQDRVEKPFDCIVGNPPFIRYQKFPEPSRSRAMQIMEASGLTPNRLTNVWVPFVVASVNCLAAGGRLAMVLPAELLQVTYAAQLRSFLVDRFSTIDIVSCNSLIFEEAEQEVVLFLGSDRSHDNRQGNRTCSIALTEANAFEDISFKNVTGVRQRRTKSIDHENEKWLKYFLSAREISFMRSLRKRGDLCNLSEHASIDVGVVTGRNEFFVVSRNEVSEFKLEKYVVPLLGRSAQLLGARIGKDEFEELASGGSRVFLLAIDRGQNWSLPSGVKRYIAGGESRDFHRGYKCRIRNPWYCVPSIWEPQCFFFRQIYDFPLVVLNQAGATSTDTIHRMRCFVKDPRKLVVNLYTFLTAASAEIEGRSYGGGVLELEPTEAEKLLLSQRLGVGMPLNEIDRAIRRGRISDALELNSRLILGKHLGFSSNEIAMLRRIWEKMRNRRMARRKRIVRQ